MVTDDILEFKVHARLLGSMQDVICELTFNYSYIDITHVHGPAATAYSPYIVTKVAWCPIYCISYLRLLWYLHLRVCHPCYTSSIKTHIKIGNTQAYWTCYRTTICTYRETYEVLTHPQTYFGWTWEISPSKLQIRQPVLHLWGRHRGGHCMHCWCKLG